jgi:hypothetical protein
MRSVSSKDEIFFVRMASADCKAVAKSSSGAAGAAILPGADDEELCRDAEAVAAKTSVEGKAVAARAKGTEARKSRRFIMQNAKGGSAKGATRLSLSIQE